jgi:carbamoyl-phosphate synthase small subunit
LERFLSNNAVLVLEDGTIYRGVSIGCDGETVGEVVFNTAMSGYQEILTDPSYAQQLVTLTYPHIGNTGTNSEDEEADSIFCSGLIIRNLPVRASSYRSTLTLDAYLKKRNIIGIAEIDTRSLTRRIREKGSMSGAIVAGDIDEVKALELAKSFPGLAGADLAKEVTTSEPYVWNEGSWTLESGHSKGGDNRFKVVAFDFGVKKNILRLLSDRNCEVLVVPATSTASEVMSHRPDGVFLSNGPGDPEPCEYAIEAIAELLTTDIPMFGICLGHQLLALASGAKTMKMKFGHHGANHPVQDLRTQRVYITSQNHGFAVNEESLPDGITVTHRSLFDNTIQGIQLDNKKAFSFQGHPEASPGPHDINDLFDRFITLME